jgi:hypothetical protein
MDASDSQRKSDTNHFVLAAIGTSFLAVIGCTFPFVSMQLRSPLPYMATPRHKVERALKFLMERRRNMHLKNDYAHRKHKSLTSQCSTNNAQLRFVDLGSGDGTTIFTAASLSWKSTGIELNPTLWAISSLRRIFQSSDIRSNCTFIHGDMFRSTRLKEELKKANCVMVFGVNLLMPKIADLIHMECDRGVFVMSYRFRVPLLPSENGRSNSTCCDRVHGGAIGGVIGASLIYEEEEMRVYEVNK